MTIFLEHNLDLLSVGDLHAVLMEASTQTEEIILNAGSVERIDGSAMQLLASFCKTLQDQNRSYQWTGTSQEFRRAAQSLGLIEVLNLV